ncbi:hypothetical protein BBO_07760 [Beauveria brongniartii RCEF 3172]|uniref:Uncharacterized protein n=1 Tax=Beauveria brongniartii RCEF 3172 TaxID=1081107 RepID=A0A166YME7_9HYPO|nr:hypothetical protein BBO_07760 [Beauveria brongniartii RCEF 3172]
MPTSEATLTQTPLHVLGLVLRSLDSLRSLGSAVLAHPAHGVVEDLTARLVNAALPACEDDGYLPVGGDGSGALRERGRATRAETARIHRMLYGYEIYCGLLFRDENDCKADLSWRTDVNFQLSAALYNENVVKANNQLACIHDFLENIVLSAFKQVAMYDVTWGAHEVDYLSTGSANEHVQAHLSLGLDYIYKLAQANTPLPPSASPDARLQRFRLLRRMLLTHRYSATSALPPRAAYMLASELNERAVERWAAEGAAREAEVEEREWPAMKRSWAKRKDMYDQGYRGFYMEH